MKSAYQIIRRPVITEKGLGVKETDATLVFEIELMSIQPKTPPAATPGAAATQPPPQ